MPEVHALLSASGASRWMACTPSARLESTFANSSSPFAEEGTKAHRLAELKLRKFNGEISAEEYNAEVSTMEIDREMEEATNYYVDIVQERLAEARSYSADAILLIEQRLDFSNYVPEGFGTGDAVIVSSHAIEVIDLKYGKGIPVSAINNPQERLYALGAYNLFGSLYEPEFVITTIIQPRLDSVSSEELEIADLLYWADNTVKSKADLAYKGKGEFVSGDHCRFCKAAKVCRARAEEALSVVKHEFKTPPILSDEEIPTILPLLDKLVAWAKDIKDYAYQRALEGKQWEGYKLVEGRSNRKYTDEAVVVGVLKDAGIEDEVIYSKSLNSITNLEKKLGKAKFNELLGNYIVNAL